MLRKQKERMNMAYGEIKGKIIAPKCCNNGKLAGKSLYIKETFNDYNKHI